MARRLILDTGVLITTERGQHSLTDLVIDDDDVAIAAITAAELLVGVELASPTHRPARHAFVDRLLRTIPIEEYGLDVARAHALLLAHVRRMGVARGAHDLVIAATAAATDRVIVTGDSKARFDELPQVNVLILS